MITTRPGKGTHTPRPSHRPLVSSEGLGRKSASSPTMMSGVCYPRLLMMLSGVCYPRLLMLSLLEQFPCGYHPGRENGTIVLSVLGHHLADGVRPSSDHGENIVSERLLRNAIHSCHLGACTPTFKLKVK